MLRQPKILMLDKLSFVLWITATAGQTVHDTGWTVQSEVVPTGEIHQAALLQTGTSRRSVADTLGNASSTQNRGVCGVLWHLHIGKCAGTSTYDWLKDLRSAGLIHEIFELLDYHGNVNFDSFYHNTLQPVLANPVGKLVAVHHHHGGPGLYGSYKYFEEMENKLHAHGCSLVRFTLLRQPVDLMLSQLNYVMTWFRVSLLDDPVEHNNWMRWKLTSDADFDNHMVRYTLNNWKRIPEVFPMQLGVANEAALNAAINILDQFEVVGIVDKLGESIAEVRRLLGFPPKPAFQHHNSGDLHKLDAHRPPGLLALMTERTRLDKRLYERYASKWLR